MRDPLLLKRTRTRVLFSKCHSSNFSELEDKARPGKGLNRYNAFLTEALEEMLKKF